MTTHELKTWPEYFGAIAAGEKTFEIRNDDRNYQTGDVVTLREYDPMVARYTGRHASFRIGFIFRSGFGLELDGHVVLSLLPVNSAAARNHITGTVHGTLV